MTMRDRRSPDALATRLIEISEDEPPRGQAVLTPSVGRDQALVRASADSIGFQLRQCLRVGRRPAAVHLEPRVGVEDCLFRGRRHSCIMAEPLPPEWRLADAFFHWLEA